MTRRWRACRTALCLAMLSAAGLTAAADQRLVDAVKHKNVAAVRTLLKQGVDVNVPQGDGATALHWAVHLDDFGTVDLLIRSGARVDAADDTGATPLYLACLNRNDAMVNRLLAAGANANAALFNGETALMTCALTGIGAAVEALLAHGANVNAKEPAHQQTALMWAAAQRHSQVVAALIAHGADVRARSRVYTQTVTSEVTQRAGREELNYTVPRGGSTPLLFAARVGDAESAKLLVEAGADVDDALPNGATALVEAAHSGHDGVGILLLEKGATPNAAAAGYTALHAAVLRGRLELVNALLAHGANPNLPITKGTPVRRNSEDFELPATLIGATPYLLAAKFLEVDIMQALATAGADPQLPMKTGATPLMAAAGIGAGAQTDRRGLSILDGGKLEPEERVLKAVTAALDLGSDVNAVDNAGDTALHGAAALGYDSVVQLLATRGANVNVQNNRHLTPLAAATGKGGERVRAPDRSTRAAGPSTVDLLRKLGGTE
jgi:ankyrin repeat protein